MAVVGALGWSALAAVTLSPTLGPSSLARPDWLAFTMFLVVIIAARAMAVPFFERSVVSLDSGFYIAAAVCLGSLVAGRLVAAALLVDTALRMRFFDRRGRDSSRRSDTLLYGFYFGGMTGALLMAIAWAFDLDSLYILAGLADLEVLERILVVGLVFLSAHYLTQGLRLKVAGEPFVSYLHRMAAPGVVAELALLPLAAIVVFLYHPDQPLKLALLGSTYLLIVYAFNRVSFTSAQLRSRVRELEILNAASRRLAASLQTHELVETLVRETMAALPEADVLTLAHRDGDVGDGYRVEIFDRSRASFERGHTSGTEGLTGRVIAARETVYIPSGAGGDRPDTRSWLGVPMMLDDRVGGVLAVESRSADAFTGDHRQLLEAIAAQASVALQNAQLYQLAMVDGLTRLYVRRYFDARLEEEMQRADRFDSEFSMAMMDLDSFKRLNDEHGHVVGDKVLRMVASIVKAEMRGVDTASRYGGEEFALILPRTTMVDAYNQAERIRQRIERAEIVEGETIVRVTASFGIASHPESGASSGEELVRLADRALYRAKRTGKNRVELYWPSDEDAAEAPPDGEVAVSQRV